MMHLYHVTGHMNIVVRASSPEKASEIAFDVAEDNRMDDVTNIEVNELVFPQGEGYLYPKGPTYPFDKGTGS